MTSFKEVLQKLNEKANPVVKYKNQLYNAKTLKELQSVWKKCLNNKDGLENYDIADLRSIYDGMKDKLK